MEAEPEYEEGQQLLFADEVLERAQKLVKLRNKRKKLNDDIKDLQGEIADRMIAEGISEHVVALDNDEELRLEVVQKLKTRKHKAAKGPQPMGEGN